MSRWLDSLGFGWDAPIADLLAENETPRWLACLGLIRRLWPTPPATSGDLDALQAPFEIPGSTDAAAEAFWSCLRVAVDDECPEGALHEARRRMKALRPARHALFMRRARV